MNNIIIIVVIVVMIEIEQVENGSFQNQTESPLARMLPRRAGRHVYDAELRSTLAEVLNIDFSCESAWSQATLPVCFGGIWVCRASQLAPLASATGSYDLINQILAARFSGIPYTAVDAAVIQWRVGHNYPPPVSPSSSRQKAWDLPHVHMISSYRVPLTAGPVPGYWQQPLKSLGPGCMSFLSLP